MKKLITAATVSAGILLSTPALARQVEVEITNLTNGLYFTPLLVAAHNRHTDLDSSVHRFNNPVAKVVIKVR